MDTVIETDLNIDFRKFMARIGHNDQCVEDAFYDMLGLIINRVRKEGGTPDSVKRKIDNMSVAELEYSLEKILNAKLCDCSCENRKAH